MNSPENIISEKITESQTIDYSEPLHSVFNKIKEVEDRQETVLSDLRQESNNIINKFNAWLGFWIAILAIFGGIIPMVVQFILREKSKKELEDQLKKIKECVTNHQLFLNVSSIYIDRECSVVSDTTNKQIFLSSSVGAAKKSFEELLSLVDNNHNFLSREAELPVINSLIQYCRLIDLCKAASKGARIRQLNNISDRIKTTISMILDHKKCSRTMAWGLILDLLPHLYNLPLNNEQ